MCGGSVIKIQSLEKKYVLTGSRSGANIVVFAYEFVFVEHVKFFAGRQLFPTNHAREALQMEHLVFGPTDQVVRRDPLSTPGTLRPVSSANGKKKTI